jgi:hypothetical protein
VDHCGRRGCRLLLFVTVRASVENCPHN